MGTNSGSAAAAARRSGPHQPSSDKDLPTSRDIAIVPAAAGDIGALAAIERLSFRGDRLSPASLRRFVAQRTGLFLVARSGPEICGYVLALLQRNSRRARLYSLAVRETRRGAGIGARLLAAVEAAAAGRGAERMYLEVRADNAEAIAMYQRAGYRQYATVGGYYEDGAAALRLEKPIGGSGRSGGGGMGRGRAPDA